MTSSNDPLCELEVDDSLGFFSITFDDNDGAESLQQQTEDVSDFEGEEGQFSTNKRALQHVTTLDQRTRCLRWMISDSTENGELGVISRAVSKFPEMFRWKYKANIQKCSRWWKRQHSITSQINAKVLNLTS